jgi:hypothetical protein
MRTGNPLRQSRLRKWGLSASVISRLSRRQDIDSQYWSIYPQEAVLKSLEILTFKGKFVTEIRLRHCNPIDQIEDGHLFAYTGDRMTWSPETRPGMMAARKQSVLHANESIPRGATHPIALPSRGRVIGEGGSHRDHWR